MRKAMVSQRHHAMEALTGYLFVLPQITGFVFIVLIPLTNVLIYSLFNKNMLYGTNLYIGIDNFVRLSGDGLFQKSLFNTLVFSACLVPLNVLSSLLLAVYLGEARLGSRYIRSIIFLPVVTSGVAWAIVWKYLLQGGTAGPVNWLLDQAGIAGPNWLNEKGWAMFSVIVNRVLKNLGTNVLIFLGAVMNMPGEVIEAARIDGAKGYRLFRYVKAPLLMPTILMVTIVTVIGSMRVFDTIKLMTDGGPEGSTMVLVYYVYHKAFKTFETGYASAIATVLFALVLLLTIAQWALKKKVSHYE
ncbi:MAG: carbohydrate ABC transporter permease [Christensenellales bacterium]